MPTATEQPSTVRESTEQDAIIAALTSRIRTAQRGGTWQAAHEAATEIAEHIERVIDEVRAESGGTR